MNEEQIIVQSDKAGIASALLCTAHCLVVPVAFLLRSWLADGSPGHILPAWWEKLDYLFLVISFIAVYHSAGHTKYKEIKMALWTFWVILAAAILMETTMHWMTYIASAGLIATHFINIKRLRKPREAAKKPTLSEMAEA